MSTHTISVLYHHYLKWRLCSVCQNKIYSILDCSSRDLIPTAITSAEHDRLVCAVISPLLFVSVNTWEIQIQPSPGCGFCLQVICLDTLSKHKELLPTRCHHLSPQLFVLGLFPIVSMIMFSLLPDWLPHIFRWFRCSYFLRERIKFLTNASTDLCLFCFPPKRESQLHLESQLSTLWKRRFQSKVHQMEREFLARQTKVNNDV